MIFSAVLLQLLSLMAIAAVGFILTKLGIITPAVAKGISGLLTKGCLPFLLIVNMQFPFQKSVLSEMGSSALGFFLVMLLSALPVLPALRASRTDRREAGVLLACACFPNVVYIGRPLMEAIYGGASNVAVTAIVLVFNLVVFSVGVLFVTMGGAGRQTPGKLLKQAFLNPIVIGGAVGILLFFFSVELPPAVVSPMKMLTAMITPLSMIIVGYSLTKARIKEILLDRRVYLISLIRLVLVPVAVFFLFRPLIANPMILGVLTVSAGLPTGANVGVLAELYDNNAVLASKSILLSTVLCLVTTPLIAAFLVPMA